MTKIQIMDRATRVARVELIDGKMVITEVESAGVLEMLEDMRHGRTDTELFNSLNQRLRGYVWAGTLRMDLPQKDHESGAG